MLSLSRKIGQAIEISTRDGPIIVHLHRLKSGRATLGIEAPRQFPIKRVDHPTGRTAAVPAN